MVEKTPGNADGKFYVAAHCINCSLCAEIAADIFATNHDDGYEFVQKQPGTGEALALVEEAMDLCPANAIRDDG